MGKLTTYVLLMSGITLLFYITGLLNGTPNSTLLNLLLDFNNLNSPTSSLFNGTRGVATLLAGIAAVGIVVGIFTTSLETVMKASFGLYMISLFWDFLAVSAKVYSINPILSLLIFAPLMVLWAVTIMNFVSGSDN